MSVCSLQNNFSMFITYAIYEVSFFIFFTTIGLNIIFGIIVDTFSELRDLKVDFYLLVIVVERYLRLSN